MFYRMRNLEQGGRGAEKNETNTEMRESRRDKDRGRERGGRKKGERER